MFNTMNTKEVSATFKLVDLERLINLLKGGFKSLDVYRNAHVVFSFNRTNVNNNAEGFKLDEEDMEYLYKKYSKKYKEELQTKLDELNEA